MHTSAHSTAVVIPFRPRQQAVSQWCQAHQLWQDLMVTQFRMACAWQRVILRECWRV